MLCSYPSLCLSVSHSHCPFICVDRFCLRPCWLLCRSRPVIIFHQSKITYHFLKIKQKIYKNKVFKHFGSAFKIRRPFFLTRRWLCSLCLHKVFVLQVLHPHLLFLKDTGSHWIRVHPNGLIFCEKAQFKPIHCIGSELCPVKVQVFSFLPHQICLFLSLILLSPLPTFHLVKLVSHHPKELLLASKIVKKFEVLLH